MWYKGVVCDTNLIRIEELPSNHTSAVHISHPGHNRHSGTSRSHSLAVEILLWVMTISCSNPYVSTLQTFYNNVGSSYDKMTGNFHGEGARSIVEAAGSAITEGCYVLDLACGTGNVALCAAAKVGSTGRVLGIDISETFLAQASEKASEFGLANVAKFNHQDVTNLQLPQEFKGRKFDVITCGSAIAMFPDLQAVVRVAATKILKPGGLFIADMNAGNIPASVFLDATVAKGFNPPFDPLWLAIPKQALQNVFVGSDFDVGEILEKDNNAGTKKWDVGTTEKSKSVWTNIAEQQSWVSFGLGELSAGDLAEAKQDFMTRISELKNEEGLVVGHMKQYIVVAKLKAD